MLKQVLLRMAIPLFLILLAGILLCGEMIGATVRSAMQVCAELLIPSLFPLSVISSFLVKSGIADRIFAPWCRRAGNVLRCDAEAVSAVFLGLLCGYPIGASCLRELYKNKAITADEAERLAACCTNAGPAFLIGVAGRHLLGSAKAGFLLMLVQLGASALTAFLMRPATPQRHFRSSHGEKCRGIAAFPEAVSSASASMLNITGFVVAASILCSAVRRIIPFPAPSALLCGIIELTNGLQATSELVLPVPVKFILFSSLLGFSGICVHLQVASVFLPDSIGMKHYLAGKLFHGGCSTLLSLPVSLLLRGSVSSAIALPPTGYRLAFPLFGNSVLLFSILYTFLWKSIIKPCIMDLRRTSGGSNHVI